jgi:hypothetical protein
MLRAARRTIWAGTGDQRLGRLADTGLAAGLGGFATRIPAAPAGGSVPN